MKPMKIVSLLSVVLFVASCGSAASTSKAEPAEEGEPVACLTDSLPYIPAEEENPFAQFTELYEDEARIEETENIRAILSEHPELAEWRLYVNNYNQKVFFAFGNFFGERDDDLALLIHAGEESGADGSPPSVKLCILNKGSYGIYFIGLDEHSGGDYAWVGELRVVPAGEPLWSNYEDDFRSFSEVPEEEIVYLDYDALFVHADGACGGGFIFWKEDDFHWLQQE